MAFYLQTWTDGAKRALDRAGQPLVHAASNQYGRLGIGSGDTLYIAYLDRRHLHLLGRLDIEQLLSQDETERYFGHEVWIADSHAIGTGSHVARFDVQVPSDVLRSLRFQQATGRITFLD